MSHRGCPSNQYSVNAPAPSLQWPSWQTPLHTSRNSLQEGLSMSYVTPLGDESRWLLPCFLWALAYLLFFCWVWFVCIWCHSWASQVVWVVKNLPADAGDSGGISGSGWSPGWGHSSPSSILAWRIPWIGVTDLSMVIYWVLCVLLVRHQTHGWAWGPWHRCVTLSLR